MEIINCYLTNNDCYKAGRYIKPMGIMVHSTGANNPNISRYAQPSKNDPNYNQVISIIGKNYSNNSWNTSGIKKCVHAFIGKDSSGMVRCVKTLPWNLRGWHSGGKANNTHISFEICEDGLNDYSYFLNTYKAAVKLVSMLCKMYNLDPLKPGIIIDHQEGHQLKIASNHGDVLHWWKRYGYSMDNLRNDVYKSIKGDNMSGKEIYDSLIEYTSKLSIPEWAKEEYNKAIEAGITDGKNPCCLIPRYQAAIMAYRAKNGGG